MDHLPGLHSPNSIIAKEVKCARTKSTAAVKHAIAPSTHKMMISKVTLSPVISILMDESIYKCEGTLIRYYDKSSQIAATRRQEVPEANASNLFEE